VTVGSDAATDEPEAADDDGADAPSGTLEGRSTRAAAMTSDAATAAISAAGTWARGAIRLSIRAVVSVRDRPSHWDIAADLERLHEPTDDRRWRGVMGRRIPVCDGAF
jgi:hypothetical protein